MISVKQITILNAKIRAIKDAALRLSGNIYSLNLLMIQFGIDPKNPISKSAWQVKEDYKTLAESVGKLAGDLKEIELEILTMDEN